MLTRNEIPNLYVMDSSIFPTSVGANPMQAIYTFAKIFSDRLLAGMDQEVHTSLLCICARTNRWNALSRRSPSQPMCEDAGRHPHDRSCYAVVAPHSSLLWLPRVVSLPTSPT